jgi:hypothetical protein
MVDYIKNNKIDNGNAKYEWIMVAVLGVYFGYFYLFKLPQNWLGGMDGYFYGLMIKNYIYNDALTALDGVSPLNYPPYYFYLLGKAGSALGIFDVGVLSFFGLFISYIVFLIYTYKLLNYENFTKSPLLAISLLLSMSGLGYGGIHIWQKSHEIIAVTGVIALIVYIRNFLNNVNMSDSIRLSIGAGVGFSIGSYTPFLIIPLAVFVCLLIFNKIVNSRLNKPLDFYFWFGLILLASPYTVTLVMNFISNEHGIGVVTWFLYSDLQFNFLALDYRNISYYISVTLSVFVLLCGLLKIFGYQTKLNFECFDVYLSVVIITSLAVYSVIALLAKEGFYFTAPFKYILLVPIFGAFLVIKIFGGILKKLITYRFTILSILSFILFLILRNIYVSDIKQSTILSEARNKNLSQLVTVINKKKGNDWNAYIGSQEARFLDFYVIKNFVNKLPFNHSYASVYEDIPSRINQLNEIANADSGAELLIKKLHQLRVDVLILADEEGEYFNIDCSINDADRMEIPKKVKIKKSHLMELLDLQKLKFYKHDQYSIYYF